MSPSCCWKGRDCLHPVSPLSTTPALLQLLNSAGLVQFSDLAEIYQGFYLVSWWFIELKELTEELREFWVNVRRKEREENGAELPSIWKGVWAWNIKSIRACPSKLGFPELIAEVCTWNMDVYPALYHQREIY